MLGRKLLVRSFSKRVDPIPGAIPSALFVAYHSYCDDDPALIPTSASAKARGAVLNGLIAFAINTSLLVSFLPLYLRAGSDVAHMLALCPQLLALDYEGQVSLRYVFMCYDGFLACCASS